MILTTIRNIRITNGNKRLKVAFLLDKTTICYNRNRRKTLNLYLISSLVCLGLLLASVVINNQTKHANITKITSLMMTGFYLIYYLIHIAIIKEYSVYLIIYSLVISLAVYVFINLIFGDRS